MPVCGSAGDVEGERDAELMRGPNDNFASVLRLRTAARFEAPCLIVPGGPTISYGALYDLAARMGSALTEAGVEPGSRVVVQVDKSPWAVALYLACLHTGAVHVPLNPGFTLAEVGYYIEDSDPTVVVTTSERAEATQQLGSSVVVLTLDAGGAGTLTDRSDALPPMPVAIRDEHDLAALVYTSGTTGRPKGSMVTHANIRHNAEALYTAWDCSPDDALLHILPIFHVHGLFVALHCAMLGGVPIHFLPKFDLDTVISLIPESTVMMGVPTHYNRLMADTRFDSQLCGNIRLFTCGSAPLPAAAFEAFEQRTGHKLCERYGMSEAGIITSNPYNDARIAGTVGYPLKGYQIRTVDKFGHKAAADSDGMVQIKGPHLFSGYWRNNAATRDAHNRNGWFTTGDIGRIAADGRLTLEGRAGDMIISGGENIHPLEIETLIDRIDGVVESAVIGVPHPDLGEAVVAVAVLERELGCDEIAAVLRKNLASYKHPKSFEVIDELPRNAMGKVLKSELRSHFSRLFVSTD